MQISRALILLVLVMLFVSGIQAQDITPTITSSPTATPTFTPTPTATSTITPTPTATNTAEPDWVTVSATADDGLGLVGDFYPTVAENPTVILLHQLYTDRSSWTPYMASLRDAGINVLVVDLRGHGLTGGEVNWIAATQDVQSWFNWLRTEAGVRPDAISVMGSSMGANLAIVGCGADVFCRSAIAISPGWEYYGLSVELALEEQLANRTALIIYAERDRYPAIGVPLMKDIASEQTQFIEFPGNAHGMNLYKIEVEALMPVILGAITANPVIEDAQPETES